VRRFRPIPDEGPFLPYVVDNVAEHSVRQVPGGWSWKFDRGIFASEPFDPAGLSRVDCRVAFFRAERGMVSEQDGEVIYDRLGRAAPIIEIPAAGHHVMLDEPLSLVTGLRTILADWDHSTPFVNP
jgi:pimeloyl-ACP methyl ester carboxylesterase